MKRFLGRYGDVAFAAMRVVLAFLYLCHGIQKLTGALGGHQMPLASLLGVAAVLEVVLGSLIAIGLLTSWAAFVASGEMAVAYLLAHFPRGGLPIQNGGELAVALCFAFLYIAAHGGGRLSLDALIGRAG
jgi:putative oxidoreductase